MLNTTLNSLCALNQLDYDSAQATELAELEEVRDPSLREPI
jgi:hypothetical protein